MNEGVLVGSRESTRRGSMAVNREPIARKEKNKPRYSLKEIDLSYGRCL